MYLTLSVFIFGISHISHLMGSVNGLAHARAPRAVHGSTPNRGLLLLLLDGVRWDQITSPDLPGFARLIAGGVRAEHMEPVFPTNAFPNYFSIATGKKHSSCIQLYSKYIPFASFQIVRNWYFPKIYVIFAWFQRAIIQYILHKYCPFSPSISILLH